MHTCTHTHTHTCTNAHMHTCTALQGHKQKKPGQSVPEESEAGTVHGTILERYWNDLRFSHESIRNGSWFGTRSIHESIWISQPNLGIKSRDEHALVHVMVTIATEEGRQKIAAEQVQGICNFSSTFMLFSFSFFLLRITFQGVMLVIDVVRA